MVVLLAWLGAMKFNPYEAGVIEGLVTSSGLVSWHYSIFSSQGTSYFVGSIEILAAVALLVCAYNRHFAIVGAITAITAIAAFAVILGILFITPDWEARLGGFPALSEVPGQFLLKDLVPLAAAILMLGKACNKSRC